MAKLNQISHKLLSKMVVPLARLERRHKNKLADKLLFPILAKTATKHHLLQVKGLEEIYGSKLKKLHPLPSETALTPEAKDFQLRSYLADLEYLYSDTYTTPSTYTTILKGVLYCPEYDLILTKSREIISESYIPTPGRSHNITISNKKYFDWRKLFRQEVEVIPGYCSVFRGMPLGYHHSLLEYIPRVYLLNQPEYSHLNEIKILCPDKVNGLESFLLPKIAPSNAKISTIPSGRLYYLENLIFTSFLSKRMSPYFPSAYLEKLRTSVLPQRPRNKKNRIYISRLKCAQSRKRHILNEDELFEPLKKIGFKKYFLEDLSIEEKVELFYDAEIVVAAEGTGLGHTIFSEAANLVILAPGALHDPPFYYMAKSLNHKIHYWHGNETDFCTNFDVNVSEVLAIVDSLETGSVLV